MKPTNLFICYAARENWGGLARDHLESGNHEQQASYD
jgi:hypothetical protein